MATKKTDKSKLRQMLRLYAQGESLLPEPGDKYKALEPFFPIMEKELKKRGMTRQILWERYIASHPDGYKVSQFKYHCQQWLKLSNPVKHI